MATTINIADPRGSSWHRWDPHIHAPGTALNDQYDGSDPWNDFLARIEASNPPIQALGVTDYCGIDCYLQTITKQREGRLPNVGLIFPNVEFRLLVGTSKGPGINLHLLFCPNDADHPERIQGFLDRLVFPYQGEQYRCNAADLAKLGRAHNAQLTDDKAAHREGVNLFKLDFEKLREAWKNSAWVQENCLVAVSGGGRDGTSGLQGDGGQWEATRKNIEGFAKIIFSANPKQIDFYLGRGQATIDDLERKWGGRKPCLHGSDAHEPERVGAPDQARRCWLKGDLTFDTLRQGVIEPEGRVYIGEAPPRGALPGNSIHKVTVSNAPWMQPSSVPLNPGMVAIVGARGSGKTALADLIATGGFGVSSQLSKSSFLRRAAEYLSESNVQLAWESGSTTENNVSAADDEGLFDAPHVQYLSQQFVEQLCSSEGLDDALIKEIQRVVFDAHPEAERMGAQDFDELLGIRMGPVRQTRDRHRQAVARIAEAMTAEQLRKDTLKNLTKEQDEKKKAIAKDKADRQQLVPKGQAERTERLEQITAAWEAKQQAVAMAKLKQQALAGLQSDARDFVERIAPDWLDEERESRVDAGLSDTDWQNFRVRFEGDVDALIRARMKNVSQQIQDLEGSPVATPPENADVNTAFISDQADLHLQNLALLTRERERLQRLVGIDEQNARRYQLLTERIGKSEAALRRVDAEIERAAKADEALKDLRRQRKDAYQGVFEAVVQQERELAELYAPLQSRIAAGLGAVSKLSFSVRRVVDLAGWAERGESLLDLRTMGPFRGKGELLRAAEATLGAAWREKPADGVAAAMTEFVSTHAEALKQHMPSDEDLREWASKVSSWLYSTDHVDVSYGLQFDGVEIERLSPGTRGVVLLLLYLAIDADDDRPLIIDQPEENLDPQTVFDELVPVFCDAKRRRQIIIVTHNANLVVNTDVDQVIVAKCGPHRPGRLPAITYESGGLENPAIRASVCAILEGGERAFRERARRLRVSF